MIDNIPTAIVICVVVLAICLASVVRDLHSTDDTKLRELEQRIERLENEQINRGTVSSGDG